MPPLSLLPSPRAPRAAPVPSACRPGSWREVLVQTRSGAASVEATIWTAESGALYLGFREPDGGFTALEGTSLPQASAPSDREWSFLHVHLDAAGFLYRADTGALAGMVTSYGACASLPGSHTTGVGTMETKAYEVEVGEGATLHSVVRAFGVGDAGLEELVAANLDRLRKEPVVGVAGAFDAHVRQGDLLRIPASWPEAPGVGVGAPAGFSSFGGRGAVALPRIPFNVVQLPWWNARWAWSGRQRVHCYDVWNGYSWERQCVVMVGAFPTHRIAPELVATYGAPVQSFVVGPRYVTSGILGVADVGAGTVWDPSQVGGTVLSYLQTLPPAAPPWLPQTPGFDWLTGVAKAAASWYSGVNPGAPIDVTQVAPWVQGAVTWLTAMGPGGGVPTPLSPDQATALISAVGPAFQAAQAYFGNLLQNPPPNVPGIPPIPSGVDPTTYVTALSNTAAAWWATVSPSIQTIAKDAGGLPADPAAAWQWILTASDFVRHYLPGFPSVDKDVPKPPTQPPAVDCGATGYHFDPSQNKCVPDPNVTPPGPPPAPARCPDGSAPDLTKPAGQQCKAFVAKPAPAASSSSGGLILAGIAAVAAIAVAVAVSSSKAALSDARLPRRPRLAPRPRDGCARGRRGRSLEPLRGLPGPPGGVGDPVGDSPHGGHEHGRRDDARRRRRRRRGTLLDPRSGLHPRPRRVRPDPRQRRRVPVVGIGAVDFERRPVRRDPRAGEDPPVLLARRGREARRRDAGAAGTPLARDDVAGEPHRGVRAGVEPEREKLPVEGHTVGVRAVGQGPVVRGPPAPREVPPAHRTDPRVPLEGDARAGPLPRLRRVPSVPRGAGPGARIGAGRVHLPGGIVRLRSMPLALPAGTEPRAGIVHVLGAGARSRALRPVPSRRGAPRGLVPLPPDRPADPAPRSSRSPRPEACSFGGRRLRHLPRLDARLRHGGGPHRPRHARHRARW